jgi:hypothetical protein
VQSWIDFTSFTQILYGWIELLASTLHQQNVEAVSGDLQTHHNACRSRTDHDEVSSEGKIIGQFGSGYNQRVGPFPLESSECISVRLNTASRASEEDVSDICAASTARLIRCGWMVLKSTMPE